MSIDLTAPFLNFVSTAAVAVLAASLGWRAKQSEWKRDISRQRIATKQRLYADFLAETNRLTLESMDQKSSEAAKFHQMTGIFAEIELLSEEPLVEAARAICASVVDSHTAKPRNTPIYDQMKAAFVKAARDEISECER